MNIIIRVGCRKCKKEWVEETVLPVQYTEEVCPYCQEESFENIYLKQITFAEPESYPELNEEEMADFIVQELWKQGTTVTTKDIERVFELEIQFMKAKGLVVDGE